MVWYLWKPPTSSPYHLRQNKPNFDGASRFSVDTGYLLEKQTKGPQPNSKPQEEIKDELEQIPKSKFWGCASTVFFTMFGIMLIFSSIMTMSKGSLTYSNFWNLEVFAPTSIVIGGLVIYITLFKNKK